MKKRSKKIIISWIYNKFLFYYGLSKPFMVKGNLIKKVIFLMAGTLSPLPPPLPPEPTGSRDFSVFLVLK